MQGFTCEVGDGHIFSDKRRHRVDCLIAAPSEPRGKNERVPDLCALTKSTVSTGVPEQRLLWLVHSKQSGLQEVFP